MCAASALDGWESDGLANLSKTTLYQDIKRLANRCRAVFGCLDMEYDVDDIVLDYVIYRLVCFFGCCFLFFFASFVLLFVACPFVLARKTGRQYCAIPASQNMEHPHPLLIPETAVDDGSDTTQNTNRFRTARYDFIERPESPKSPSAKKAGGGDKGGNEGSHEPIQDMPSTLTLLVKVRCRVVCSVWAYGGQSFPGDRAAESSGLRRFWSGPRFALSIVRGLCTYLQPIKQHGFPITSSL